jgi:hypothetical protein
VAPPDLGLVGNLHLAVGFEPDRPHGEAGDVDRLHLEPDRSRSGSDDLGNGAASRTELLRQRRQGVARSTRRRCCSAGVDAV